MKTLEEIILDAYREGVFPMAESAEDEGFAFYKPHMRAIIPIDKLHVPASLAKAVRRKTFRITMDHAFEQVIQGCAASTPRRSKTWINAPIKEIFLMLHSQGHAHSIECWDQAGTLAGGLYGLAIGRVFCGESMFSIQRDASKVCLIALCALLNKAGFKILDSQFMNPHLLQFGAYEIPQEEYEGLIQTEMKAMPQRKMESSSIDYSLLDQYLQSILKK
jgi:leucyl/phenylalanyl-tRNA---protein transferase